MRFMQGAELVVGGTSRASARLGDKWCAGIPQRLDLAYQRPSELSEGLFRGRIWANDTVMKKLLVLIAAALVLAGCYSGPVDMDTYNRNHEPKTGGSDL